MPKLVENRLPAYRHHKARGLAVVRLNGHDFYLGRYGTAESKVEYDRVIAEWLANQRCLPSQVGDHAEAMTVTEVIAAYWRFASVHYRKDGMPTSEQDCIRAALCVPCGGSTETRPNRSSVRWR